MALALAAGCAALPERGPTAAAASENGAFLAAADVHYRQILARLSSKNVLDDDHILARRVSRIAPALISEAAKMRPATAAWSWELHVTSDTTAGTFCLAGGKILVDSGTVDQLQLDDGELAMLLGHEMAHAVAGHRRAFARAGVEADAAQEVRETELALGQEREADRIGMELAWRAGWPAASLVSFFDKVAAREGAGAFSTTHPSAASRAAEAREFAAKLRR